ncbi:MAG: hypothetical protein KA329_07980 [Novosphingobium sp.]|nr:hypothetical protein [Novosphingobium sp.]
MEFARDLLDSLRARASAPAQGMPSGRIDWSELHARLGAAHAAARELSLNTKGNCGLPGGFTEWKTGRGAKLQSSTPVNRTDLADGKAAEGNDVAIAGETITGGRG